jgi:hypothetical protein
VPGKNSAEHLVNGNIFTDNHYPSVNTGFLASSKMDNILPFSGISTEPWNMTPLSLFHSP